MVGSDRHLRYLRRPSSLANCLLWKGAEIKSRCWCRGGRSISWEWGLTQTTWLSRWNMQELNTSHIPLQLSGRAFWTRRLGPHTCPFPQLRLLLLCRWNDPAVRSGTKFCRSDRSRCCLGFWDNWSAGCLSWRSLQETGELWGTFAAGTRHPRSGGDKSL